MLQARRGDREARIGNARALAVEEQVRAYGGPQFQVLQQIMDRFSTAVEKSGIEIVPKMVITNGGNGNGNGGSYSAFEGLMSILLSEKLEPETKSNGTHEASGEVKRIRQSILEKLANSSTNGQPEPQPAKDNGKDAES